MNYYRSLVIMWLPAFAAQQAMVVKPVIDLFFSPEAPRSSPASFDKDYDTCLRAHQLLMHDIVTVHETHGTSCKIEVPQAYYGSSDKPSNIYWTPADNLVLLPDQPERYTVALIHPYYEPSLGILYSHGTQFIRADRTEPEPDQDMVCVYAYNPQSSSWVTVLLPKAYCLFERPQTTAEQRKLFVKLILDSIDLARQSSGVIPYVWGGKSFTFTQPDEFCAHDRGFDRTMLTNPVTGFDCSNMILHYAHLCGIAWPYKSSATLARYGTEKKPGTPIEEGDILWIPGHVMVIMKNKREIIEAAGYKWLYGRVHTIKIKDRFHGAHTIDDLLRLYQKNGHIKVYDACKNITTIPAAKVFSLIQTHQLGQ